MLENLLPIIYSYAILAYMGFGIFALITPDSFKKPYLYLLVPPGFGFSLLVITGSWVMATNITITWTMILSLIMATGLNVFALWRAKIKVNISFKRYMPAMYTLLKVLSMTVLAVGILSLIILPGVREGNLTTPLRTGPDSVGYAGAAQSLAGGETLSSIAEDLKAVTGHEDLEEAKNANFQLLRFDLHCSTEFLLKALRWGYPTVLANMTWATDMDSVYRLDFVLLVFSWAMLLGLVYHACRTIIKARWYISLLLTAALALNSNLLNIYYEGSYAEVMAIPVLFLLLLYLYNIRENSTFTNKWDRIKQVVFTGFLSAALLSIWTEAFIILGIVCFFMLFLACLVILFFKLILDSNKTGVYRSLKWTAAAAGIFFVLNLYWLIPLFTSTGTTLNQLNPADQSAFLSRPTSGGGILFDILSMHGFWREHYTYARDILPFWWILFTLVLFLAVYGFASRTFPSSRPVFPGGNEGPERIQTVERWLPISFAVIGVTGFILALGAAADYTRPFFEWLWDKVPFFKIFRDSQKFVALLCLSYAYLGGLGIGELAGMLKQRMPRPLKTGLMILIFLLLATPFIYSFTIFGFYGQLGVTDYPEEWYEVNDHLNRDSNDVNVLFLPWHMYMDYSWLPNTDKRLINPSRQFFDKPVIAGDNIEIQNIYSQSSNPISKYIEFLLPRGNEIDNLGELLAPLDVRYIILVNEADYESYDFLYRQEDLTVELQKPGITLFKNEHPASRAYAVDSVVRLDSLNEYLELSKEQDVMDHIYVFGHGSQDEGNGQTKSLACQGKSQVDYQVNGTDLKYTVFTVPQNVSTNSWEYNGQGPVFLNLGFMPVFLSSPEGGDLVYTRFYRVYLPCYVISGAMLSLMVFLLFRHRRRKTASLEG